ncbi:amidohydrolase family protein [Streptomyces sp. NPDC002159]
MPGLVEAHIHLAFDASADPVAALMGADDEQVLADMRKAARTALLAGITTVRDLGDRDFLSLTVADETAATPEAGPEILAAGPPITTPGGHCHFMHGEAAGPEALLTAVRERHERGCSVVKIMVSGGTMTPGSKPHESQYTEDELRTVVDEAHRLGLPVAAHVHATQSTRDAVGAGVDTLEHMTFWGEHGTIDDPELVNLVAASGAHVSLTVGLVGEMPPHIAERFRSRMEKMNRMHISLIGLGAKVVVGTDAGTAPMKPHDVLPYGAESLVVDLGMSPIEALQAVTSRAAAACHVQGRKGCIRKGADADFLVTRGDPSRQITKLRDVRAVFRAGARVR